MAIEDQLSHAEGFASVITQVETSSEGLDHSGIEPGMADAIVSRDVVGSGARGPLLDLGSGGGLPGLLLAHMYPSRRIVLLDASERRTAFLMESVVECGWSGRVEVVRGRAEELARLPGLRGIFSVVTARSFGSPPVTAECSTGFINAGGYLIVSEPPATQGSVRWPAEDLKELGLEPLPSVVGNYNYQVLRQATVCSDRYPRRTGIPAKRPIYSLDV